jgi:hypothetical protein
MSEIKPAKLQAWTPQWRKKRAEKIAEQYGTSVTAMINEGLDIVMEQLENRIRQGQQQEPEQKAS